MQHKPIQIAGLGDIPQLLTLINNAYRGDAAKKGWTHEADLIDGTIRTDEEHLKELMMDEVAVILKYSEGGKIQGCVYLQQQGDKVYLGMLSVSPDVQAGGIGKALLRASEEWTIEQNLYSIVMNVITVRSELITWYNKQGYNDSGIRKPFPDDKRFGIPKEPVEFMVLEKQIAKGGV